MRPRTSGGGSSPRAWCERTLRTDIPISRARSSIVRSLADASSSARRLTSRSRAMSLAMLAPPCVTWLTVTSNGVTFLGVRVSQGMDFTLFAQAAGASPPAGGAAIDQIVIATTAATIVTAILLYVGMGHRSGKVPLLGNLGAFSERVSGLPAWAAIPAATITGSLLIALFGMLWDISLHIADGRDEGPLANPAHYFILAGLFGVFAAGFLSMALPAEKPSASAVRISKDWHAPLGGVLIAAAGGFALIGFPLDDVWHR